MYTTTIISSVLATAALISTTFASPILETRSVAKRGFTPPTLVSYWGNGFDQMRLGDFCTNTTLDVIPVGFVNSFPDEEGNNGYPGTNYANACGSAFWVAPDGTQTKMFTSCWQIEEDIPKCQALGKKILASIGGHAPNNKITSKDSAIKFADFLWGSFGPLQDPDLIQFPRPFGKSVVVDGFDLDIENGGGFGYADLVNELRRLSGPKPLIISAAPQCFTNDPQLSDAIQNSVIDYVWVQYYNSDPCSAASLFNAAGTLNKNTDVSFGWVDWLKTNSKNKNIQLYLGLPASPAAANPGFYIDLQKTTALLEEFSCNPRYQGVFGGVMLWEATESARNTQANGLPFADNVKAAFGKLSCLPVVTTTTTTTTTTTSTSTTTTSTTTTTTTTTTSSTTTTPAVASTTTTTWTTDFPHGPHSSTTTEAPVTTSTSTSTTTSPAAPVTTTTTSSWSRPHGPGDETTTTSSTSAAPDTTTTTTTSSYTRPHGPGEETTSSSTTSAAPVTTTTTTSTWSRPHGPGEQTTSSSSSTTTTTTSSSSAAPVTTTTSSYSLPHGPGEWTSSSTTTSSKVVGPVTTSSSTNNPWEDWTSSSVSPISTTTTTRGHWGTTSKPVDPAQTSSISTLDEPWLDWTSSTTTSKPYGPTVTTTTWTTQYTDWDHTTFVTRTYTATTTLTVYPGTTAAPWVWPVDSNGCPHGFTTTIVTIAQPPVTSTVTLTIPIPTGAPAATPYTVWPSPSAAATAPAAPHVFAPSVFAPSSSAAAVTVAPVASNPFAPASPAATSATGVQPANVATFTGAAAQAQLPGTVLGVPVCLAFAVAGLLF